MFIKPIHPDLKVPDPIRKDFLPPEGREVEAHPYWTRRLAAEEVELIEPEQDSAEVADEEEPETHASKGK